MSGGSLYTDSKICKPPYSVVRIHPLVVFTMSDGYLRSKTENNHNVAVGLLFGEITAREAIIRDCVCCIYDESTVMKREHRSASLAAHKSQYSNESFIGWWSFSDERINFAEVVPEDGAPALYVWARPYLPPKIDVFSITKTREGQLISTPLVHTISASVEEQLGLSRLADTGSKGSLQAAVHELINLMEKMKKICSPQAKGVPTETLVGREIYRALWQTYLQEDESRVLDSVISSIDEFLKILGGADSSVGNAESLLSLHLD